MRIVNVLFGHDFFGGDAERMAHYRSAVAQACEQANQDPDILAAGLHFNIIYANSRPDEIRATLKNPIVAGRRVAAKHRYRNDGRFWMKIRALILACDYALFDVSYRDNEAPFNSNVILEYGVAIGLNKIARFFGNSRENFKKFLSDQQGYDFPQYNSLEELREVVKELLIDYLEAIPQ